MKWTHDKTGTQFNGVECWFASITTQEAWTLVCELKMVARENLGAVITLDDFLTEYDRGNESIHWGMYLDITIELRGVDGWFVVVGRRFCTLAKRMVSKTLADYRWTRTGLRLYRATVYGINGSRTSWVSIPNREEG